MRSVNTLSLSLLLLASALTTPTHGAFAQDGIYIAGLGGLNFASDADFSFEGPTLTNGFGGEVDYDPGFHIGAAAGYALDLEGDPAEGLGLRPEIEISYRHSGIDSLFDDTFGTFTDVDGRLTNLSGMANLWLDYKLRELTPYVGFGVGVSRVKFADVSITNVDIIDDSDVQFAYQLGAGIAYSLNSTIDLTAGYRFFATLEPSFEAANAFAPVETVENVDNYSHSVLLGVRYNF